MSVTPSTAIAVETLATKDQLWALEFLFAANWINGTQVKQSYSTDINRSQNDAEQRWGLVRLPYRSIEAELLVRSSENMSRLRNLAARAATSRWLVPMYSDESIITADSSSTTLNCNTDDRRFSVGARVAVVGWTNGKEALAFLGVATISGVTSTTLIITGAMAGVLTGMSVFPLIEAELNLDSDWSLTTDAVAIFKLEAKEVAGSTALDSFQIPGDLPAGISTFGGKLILNAFPTFGDKNTVGVSRSGAYTNVGRGKILQVFGSRPRFKYDMSYLESTRAEAVKLIRFFEAVGGRLLPFYVISPASDLAFTGFATTSITVTQTGPLIDWNMYTHVAVVMKDGTVLLRSITSVARGGGSDVITVPTFGTAPTLTDVARVSFAQLCRLDSDEMVENWITNTVLTVNFPCIEVVQEADLTIANITGCCPDAPVAPSIIVQPNPYTALAGATASFSVSAIGTPLLHYQWQKQESGVGGWSNVGTDQNTYVTGALTVVADDTDKYRVIVTNDYGTVTSNEVAVTVAAAPVITANPVSTTVTQPATATFSVTASGTSPLTYQWQRSDNGGVSWTPVGTNSNSYTTPATVFANDNADRYRCVVTNAYGSATSGSALLTVQTVPVITVHPADATVAHNAATSTSFSVTASGSPAVSYQWQKSDNAGGSWANVGTNSNTLSGIVGSQSGSRWGANDEGDLYRCVVSNAAGSVTSNPAKITMSFTFLAGTAGGTKSYNNGSEFVIGAGTTEVRVGRNAVPTTERLLLNRGSAPTAGYFIPDKTIVTSTLNFFVSSRTGAFTNLLVYLQLADYTFPGDYSPGTGLLLATVPFASLGVDLVTQKSIALDVSVLNAHPGAYIQLLLVTEEVGSNNNVGIHKSDYGSNTFGKISYTF